MTKPELLLPAGDLEKLKYAFHFGADAVYLGVPYFSLRARANEFDFENLRKGIEYGHSLGKKVYVTANIFARNRKLSSFLPAVGEWLQLKPDALIMSDPGLMMMVREQYPDVELHLSVQANSMNWQNVKFWHKSLNVRRVILSRELSLNEIKEIRDRVPDVELEAFVHGAICIAFSGRCLMSSYMSHRDANQGVCDNSCREKYKVHDPDAIAAKAEEAAQPTAAPLSADPEKELLLEDMRDPGKLYSVKEDEEGTYFFNAKDLCLIPYLQELRDAGVCSFKVEGRTKSVYYVSCVARAYRQAIDDMMAGKGYDPALMDELNKISNRGYHMGFFNGQPGVEGQNYDAENLRFSTHKFAGLAQGDINADGYFPADVRGTIKLGMEVEILGPQMQTQKFTVQGLLNSKMQTVEAVHPGAGTGYLKGALRSPENGILNVLG